MYMTFREYILGAVYSGCSIGYFDTLRKRYPLKRHTCSTSAPRLRVSLGLTS